MNVPRLPSFLLTIVFALLIAGCQHKTTATKAAPPAPSPAATAATASPVADLTVTPSTVERGQSAELRWNTQNASSVNIDDLGSVPATGSRRITPGDSTTYRLTAKGDGGTAEASARITVNAAASSSTTAELTEQQMFDRNIKDIFFAYDKADIQSEQQQIVSADAQFLAQHPDIKLVIAGHCDERGSDEYNMGLGENRADQVKEELVKRGVSANRIRIISYGKEKPFCTSTENESCWQQNRRAHFAFSN